MIVVSSIFTLNIPYYSRTLNYFNKYVTKVINQTFTEIKKKSLVWIISHSTPHMLQPPLEANTFEKDSDLFGSVAEGPLKLIRGEKT